MIKEIKKHQIVILCILVFIPFFLPYGSREYYLVPTFLSSGNAGIDTDFLSLLIILYSLFSLPYWLIVGAFFGHWVHGFRYAFLIANIPIFFNAIGELFYFGIFHMKQNTYPWIEYLIGSHIDKFNIHSIFGFDGIFLSIILSTMCFLGVFIIGYDAERKIEADLSILYKK